MRRAPILFCLAFCLLGPCSILAQQQVASPLEVGITGPLRWENGCLMGTLNISNRSSNPVFLTKAGPYYDIALDVSKDESRTGGPMAWVNVAGFSDMVVIDVEPLIAGASTHRSFCLNPFVWVVNLRLKTHRKIPLRGNMRVRVSYLATDEDVKRYVGTWNHPEHQLEARLWSEVNTQIPCIPDTCKPDCGRAPIGVEGEVRMVPDITSNWNAQGEKLAKELARKSPPCAKDKSAELPQKFKGVKLSELKKL